MGLDAFGTPAASEHKAENCREFIVGAFNKSGWEAWDAPADATKHDGKIGDSESELEHCSAGEGLDVQGATTLSSSSLSDDTENTSASNEGQTAAFGWTTSKEFVASPPEPKYDKKEWKRLVKEEQREKRACKLRKKIKKRLIAKTTCRKG